MKRFIVVAALVALGLVMHERVVESADVVAVGRETIDIGDHVAVVLDRETRVAYEVRRSALRDESVTVEQRGRAIYRVRDGALAVQSAGGALDVRGDAVIVVDGARYAVAEGTAIARALREEASLLRWVDEVNNAPGGDLVQRLSELQLMRASLASDDPLAAADVPLADDSDVQIGPDESDESDEVAVVPEAGVEPARP